ncbi:MAG TPA: TRAM domain-containing protein, partial [Candidatus Nanopelagicales bacterium]
MAVEVTTVAHGGHCVARHEGQVLFVRHALPGERVVAEVTALGRKGRSVHADVVDVLEASPQRRVPICPVADRCGGCDWQHTTPAAARGLKAQVVREALGRFAGVTIGPGFVVEPVGDPASGEPLDWLGWRTRGTLSVDAAGRAGMRAKHSHEVVVGPGCPQLHASLAPLGLFERRWEPGSRVGFVAPTGAAPLVFEAGNAPAEPVAEQAVGARWQVAADGFWQVHPGAAAALVQHVAAMLAPRPGERLVDLYAGVGLFGLSLSRLVGSDAQGQSLAVTLVEGDRRASELAALNAGDLPVTVVRAPVDRWVARPGALAGTDLVVLDPPRVGAGAGVVGALAAARPR